MLKGVKVIVPRQKKFKMFTKYLENKPHFLAKNEQNLMLAEGKTLEGTKFDDMLRNISVRNTWSNLTPISL